MIRIMCDQDVQGLAGAVLAHCRRPAWEAIWKELEIEIYTFSDLGLQQDATDAEIWSACQDNDVILLTGNRNAEGPDSLEITIRERTSPTAYRYSLSPTSESSRSTAPTSNFPPSV